MAHGEVHPALFHALCDLVNALASLEDEMPPSRHQYALHALIHRFDALIDLLVELEWPGPGGVPANDREASRGPEETR